MSVRVGWAAVGFGAGDLAVLLYVPIALPLVGAQTLGVAGSEGRATRQHRAAGGLWTRPRAIALAEHVGRAGSEGSLEPFCAPNESEQQLQHRAKELRTRTAAQAAMLRGTNG